ncbi:MAG: protein-(glutamine-N5) methyltransferase, release factor-specific [Candidatus Cloacimonadota bacterium]|nr:MAG: protein-(glutamine-N5) methyltransferase, release factor-specific [Candidatus Cloacimonadota bacterium]
MKTWTLLDVLEWTTVFFKERNIPSPRVDAEWILAHVFKIKRLEIYLRYAQPLSKEELVVIRNLVIRRANREPLQYIMGETNFYGYNFQLNESVLIPRPETEFLVERIIKENKDKISFLDIGTGSGAVSVTLAKELPGSRVTALDISAEALETAKKNAELNGAEINFLSGDIFPDEKTRFDVIVSNPPYISNKDYENLEPEIKRYEPKSALVAEENGLFFYKKILEKAEDYLNEKGIIYFEIGENQAKEIRKEAVKNGFSFCETYPDLNGFDRYMKIMK